MPELTDQELADLTARAEAGQSAAAALEQSQQDLEAARTATAAATTALRDQARAANPTLPAELIDGDTPEAIAASLDRARTIAQQVIEATRAATPTTPAASPPRTPETPPEGTRGIDRIRFELNRRAASGQ
jgi:hypothetical protein